MDLDMRQVPLEPMEMFSEAWRNSAIQVFQPSVQDCSISFRDKQLATFAGEDGALSPSNGKTLVEDGDFKPNPQLKFDDLKSWIWLQKAIHPELDYDLCKRNKWFPRKLTSWNGMSIKKWFKEMKQKRKDEGRLQRAEVHSAISVAAVAAALAAIASEDTENKQKSLKESAVASAAALVAAQCAQMAEAVGAKREQISSAISAAMTATDASDIATLTAAAATSLRGAATLRGRSSHREKVKGSSPALLHDESDFDFTRCRASLAKGDEMHVATEDGKCSFNSVSAVVNRNDKVILRMKKINALMAFSVAKESTIYELCTHPLEEPVKEADGYYHIGLKTSQGKVYLKIDDDVRYRKWIMTINHMLMSSTNFCRQEIQFYRN